MERLTNKREADAQRREYENRLKNGYPRNIPEERFLKLAAYEDTGLEPEEITQGQPSCVFYCNRQCNLDGDFCPEGPGCPRELIPDAALHLLMSAVSNPPLTLEELREMDGEPVWVELLDCNKEANWALVDLEIEAVRILKGMAIQRRFKAYGNTWMAYRRKPEKCVSTPADPAVPGWAEHLNARFLRTE